MLERIRDALGGRRELDEPAGLPFGALYPTGPRPAAQRATYPAGPRAYTGTGASQLVAAANPGRVELTIYNASGSTVYVVLGSIASSSTYTVALAAGATYILEDPDCWPGDVAASWASGAIEVTERSRGG